MCDVPFVEKKYLDKLPDFHRDSLGKNLCVCNEIPKFIIVDAIIAGATTLEDVRKQTYATDGNGCCRLQVERLIDYLCEPKPVKPNGLEEEKI
ncbi:MAG: (2Fe-2S)-binding protein [Gammaproteobacteria bacterium]|nr:(2Fe-2S)-binding protein [Gammaproteobacteria bacterium]NNJ91505.1 (2Fe-2S)-binding protein [Gammaproteobacteria bacterium]